MSKINNLNKLVEMTTLNENCDNSINTWKSIPVVTIICSAYYRKGRRNYVYNKTDLYYLSNYTDKMIISGKFNILVMYDGETDYHLKIRQRGHLFNQPDD